MTCRALALALLPGLALAAPDDTPFARVSAIRPAAVESTWSPVKMPDGKRAAFASLSYLMAVDDDWGFGPGVYGAAKGNYGGIFTAGFTAQRRWRVSANTHLAASLYVGAGGGLSSTELRFGGGLMLRPELSLRTEEGPWYSGIGVSQIRFPSGNVHSAGLSFSIGRSMGFASFTPDDSGKPGRISGRTGLGLDEIGFNAGYYHPGSSTRNRSGQPSTRRMGRAGADLRQYVADGSWWGVEAAGAAQGGADGYMEVLGLIGQDWPLGTPSLRAGGQLGLGLGGGGNVDSGNGWLWRTGPTLRWITPWGPSVRLDAAYTKAPSGHFNANLLRLSLAVPLDRRPNPASWDANDPNEQGTVRVQQLGASWQQLPHVRFKDGSRRSVGMLGIGMSREVTANLLGIARAGSAASGGAGAYSYGLFGLGLQTRPVIGSVRFGAEALVGVAGGGGVQVGGGAVMQAEAWAEWAANERLRLRAGLGEWRTVRGHDQSSTLTHFALSYAFGTLQR